MSEESEEQDEVIDLRDPIIAEMDEFEMTVFLRSRGGNLYQRGIQEKIARYVECQMILIPSSGISSME